jgi:uncharacterized integral membrane protein
LAQSAVILEEKIMTRSPDKPKAKTKSDNQLIIQLLILGLVITLIALLVVQNLQPLVEIFFLGQKTLPIPLSVTMLSAFVIGGLIAYVVNAIADWQLNKIMRRAAASENRPSSATNAQSQPTNKSTEPQNPAVSHQQDNSQDFIEDDEYYEDDEYDDEDEYYEDNDLDDLEVLDDDPDTIPYGDRLKYKSKRSPHSDRPPLEAKYIK